MLLGEDRFSLCRYPCVNVAELHTAPHLFLERDGTGCLRLLSIYQLDLSRDRKTKYTFDVDRGLYMGLIV